MLFHNSDASALHHKATRYGSTHTPPAPPPSQILINTHRLILSQARIFIRVQIPFIVINQLKTEICYNNHTKNPWKQTIHRSNRITHASATKILKSQNTIRCWDPIVRLNKWDAIAITAFLLHALACAAQKYEHETGTRLLQSKPEVTESKLCSVPPRIHWEMVSNHRENSQEYFPIYSSKSRWTPLRNKAHLSAQAEINTLQTHKVYQSLPQ